MKIGSFVVGSLSAGREGTMKVVTHPGLSASEGSNSCQSPLLASKPLALVFRLQGCVRHAVRGAEQEWTSSFLL